MHTYFRLPDGREGGACECPDCPCLDARGCDKGCDCETCHPNDAGEYGCSHDWIIIRTCKDTGMRLALTTIYTSRVEAEGRLSVSRALDGLLDNYTYELARLEIQEG